LDHYFQVSLPTGEVRSTQPEPTYRWLPLAQLANLYSRPAAIRDVIVDGSNRRQGHMLSPDPEEGPCD
jgi:hypothetical protein